MKLLKLLPPIPAASLKWCTHESITNNNITIIRYPESMGSTSTFGICNILYVPDNILALLLK